METKDNSTLKAIGIIVLAVVIYSLLSFYIGLKDEKIDNLESAIITLGGIGDKIVNIYKNHGFDTDTAIEEIDYLESQILEIESMLNEIGIDDRPDVLMNIYHAKLKLRRARGEILNLYVSKLR